MKSDLPLAAVVKHRRHTRDQRQLALRETTMAAEAVARQQEESLREQGTPNHLNREAGGPGEVDLHMLVLSAQYGQSLREQSEALGRERAALEEHIAEARRALLAAEQQLQAVEKVLQRRRQRYQRQRNRRECM